MLLGSWWLFKLQFSSLKGIVVSNAKCSLQIWLSLEEFEQLLSFCLSVFLSFCLSVFLSFCPSVLLSFCLFVFLSFWLSTNSDSISLITCRSYKQKMIKQDFLLTLPRMDRVQFMRTRHWRVTASLWCRSRSRRTGRCWRPPEESRSSQSLTRYDVTDSHCYVFRFRISIVMYCRFF